MSFGPAKNTPARKKSLPAKGHNDNEDFTTLLAGGIAYGSADEFGCKSAENPVHAHDLHATVPHFIGLDHRRLTHRCGGRDFG